jgi:hypothetical protein
METQPGWAMLTSSEDSALEREGKFAVGLCGADEIPS